MSDPSRCDALVLFGATGDLAKRKLFPALYQLTARDRLEMPVIGVARSTWNDEAFRSHAGDAIRAGVPDADPRVVERLCERLDLVAGDYSNHDLFEELAATLERNGSKHALHYLAIPPTMFPTVVTSLAAAGLSDTGRLVVEKPFGRDLASAQELNRTLHAHFDESAIFRIDHYLGKESVEDLLVFRFANSFLEPIWNRNHVASVQITMAETIGVEGRGAFYDSVGCLRDVVQNHLLQVLALMAMEPPIGRDARHLADEKLKVFEAMRPLDAASLVRGQYDGYLAEGGVAADSTTETFAALRLEIDSWRWAGVPFVIRAGKALQCHVTEAVVELHRPPTQLFDELGPPGHVANLIRFRLGADDGVTLTVNAKEPGPHVDSLPVDLRVDFAAALGARQEPYERLLDDALDGNPRRFGRFDLVEETWRVIQPALDNPGPVVTYPRGSWGPAEADALVTGDGWHAATTPNPAPGHDPTSEVQ